MMKTPILIPLIAYFLSSCASSPFNPEQEQANADLRELVKNQQALIALQSERLEVLEENQWGLMDALGGIESQMEDLSKSGKQSPKRAPAKEPARSAPKASEDTVKAAQQKLQKTVLGRVEWIWMDFLQQKLKARVDTGASSSSLNAENIKEFERDGEDWVRFTFPEDKTKKTYELPLVKYVRVKQAGSNEERRPVVMIKARIGTLKDESEFTLTNRENMLYPVLLGRSFLKDVAIVDVSRSFIQKTSVKK